MGKDAMIPSKRPLNASNASKGGESDTIGTTVSFLINKSVH